MMKFVESADHSPGNEPVSFYKELLNQVPDMIFKLVCQKSDEYIMAYVNESVNDIYELTVDQLMADPYILFRERIIVEDRVRLLEGFKYAKEQAAPWEIEYRVELPKKGFRWLRVSMRPDVKPNGCIEYFGRVTDITEIKQQKIRLQMSEERIKFALDAASEGIWDWDMVSNTTYFSGQAMKILGRDEEEALVPSSFFKDRIHPDDVKAREMAKKKGLKKGASYESIYRVRTDDGTYKWLLSRGRAVAFDEKGRPTRSMGIHKDITQLKQKELELANTINIISSQNNRLSNFAHIVSHNLRSHASNLKMLLDLFKAADENERTEMLTHLEAISDGLYVTIGHLKELVEIQFEIKIVKEKLNLRHYLKNILNILHNEITKHGVTIEINIPLDVTVEYNPAYLESILLNFTTNAIKYSSPARKPMLLFDFEEVNGQKILSISDNGLGIDLKKHKNSLFGMYKTFHKHQNSRGIGLFMTKNQIEAMGGRIEVTSEVNKGTTFKIYINDED
jgi:PAS domain S-box-containing protein